MSIISHVEVGVCGLSCRLCPAYHRETKSRCPGCKSEYRMGAACSFINCAIKKKSIEFCWLCNESKSCALLKKNREFAKTHDTSTCYQKIEENAQIIQRNGIDKFEQQQKTRENLLVAMLAEFNEGRSKSLYCVAATVMEPAELEAALNEARAQTKGMDLKQRAKIMHLILSKVAAEKNYVLKLRK